MDQLLTLQHVLKEANLPEWSGLAQVLPQKLQCLLEPLQGKNKNKSKQKHNTHNPQIFVLFLKCLLWNIVFWVGSKKQYVSPREEEPKWKWRAIVTSCFLTACQYTITKNKELGTTAYSKIHRKTTKQFLHPHLKNTQFAPHTNSVQVFQMLCNKGSSTRSFATLQCTPLQLREIQKQL